MAEDISDRSLYSQIGGQTAVFNLADQFYLVMQREAELAKLLIMHPTNLTRSRKKLAQYLCQWLGGPALFGQDYMSAEWIRQRHQHLQIGFEERDQWLRCMHIAMKDLGYNDQLRHALGRKFFQLAGFIRTTV
ncbi:MAG: hemoglobin-like protein [Gammaproteobacteria bacterium]|nr:hemoglobin-like protein [Gammaproteobacteria bacterium]